ncbi:hypothetical protein [Prosthecomicrobium pneumaticum]|uniref:Uncharacterized protein n=1 Tax=Prosthecomicrobium pneumaticum TaxID=81895 RepID=A0A7W9L1J9_9HYPH|nr:hypothetical protein [Prosthecomicrobium pneumaticum]MBB5752799.1 hypothetical protein [Prosthecomicrobium pneumaticum]
MPGGPEQNERDRRGGGTAGQGVHLHAETHTHAHAHAHAHVHAHGPAGRSAQAGAAAHAHAGSQDAAHVLSGPGAAAARERPGLSAFAASALDRMAVAAVLVGLVWIAILWAVG